MRILYVTDALAIWGGLERILVNKVNLLVSLYDYDVHLVTLNQGNHPIPYPLNSKVLYEDLGIQYHKQYQFKGVRRFLRRQQLNQLYKSRIRQIIQSIHPDVIVCSRRQLVGTIVKTKGTIPLVYESHTFKRVAEIEGKNLFTRLKEIVNRRMERLPEVVVTLTEGDAADWRKVNSHVYVIPNVVSLNVTGIYSKCQEKSVIFVGRFSSQKDIPSLLEIWKIVHHRFPDWSLQIYGGYGLQEKWLVPIIKQMDANIKIHKPTADIMDRYMESSILIMTSVYEPFGLVLPEAMSCGLPVVAFDCPYGPADIITDGEDGFLVKERNIQLFAEKLSLLMSDISLRVKMGQTGIRTSKRYVANRIMPLWKQLFEKITKS